MPRATHPRVPWPLASPGAALPPLRQVTGQSAEYVSNGSLSKVWTKKCQRFEITLGRRPETSIGNSLPPRPILRPGIADARAAIATTAAFRPASRRARRCLRIHPVVGGTGDQPLDGRRRHLRPAVEEHSQLRRQRPGSPRGRDAIRPSAVAPSSPILAVDVPADVSVPGRGDHSEHARIGCPVPEREAEPWAWVNSTGLADRLLGPSDVVSDRLVGAERHPFVVVAMTADQVAAVNDRASKVGSQFNPAALHEECSPEAGRPEDRHQRLGHAAMRATIVLGVERQRNADDQRSPTSPRPSRDPSPEQHEPRRNATTGMMIVISVPAGSRAGSRTHQSALPGPTGACNVIFAKLRKVRTIIRTVAGSFSGILSQCRRLRSA